jgi:hypothetical protein
MRDGFRRILGVLFLSLLAAASITAQVTTGTISGVVTDPTGAVVPGATATATNVATNVDYTAVTNKADGAFTINALPYGFYRVKVSASGFSNAVFENVQVNLGQISTLNAKLAVGSSVDTVMVTSELPDVQTESIAMSSAIDKRQIQNLPLNTRNPLDLVKTLPGTTTVASDFFVHGLRAQTVNLMQDGVNVSDNYVKTSGFFSLIGATVDSVSEFTVTSSTADSNSGYGSTQVNLVTTSGTNGLHGSAYWYQRTSYLNANPYFNGVTGLPTPFQLQNRIGYEVGGPVVIPKIYNGKNKTFFFNNFEVFRQPAQQNTNRLVLSDAARLGNFTYTENNGTTNTVNLLSLGSIGTQKLPAAINSQVMNYYNGLVPSANNDLCSGADAMNLRCFTWNVPGTSKSNRYVGRLDQQIGDKHTASFVYNELRTRTQSDFLNGDYPFFPNSKGAGQGGVRELFSWQFRSNIGNNKTNAASFGIQRSPVDFFINDNYAATGGFQLLPAPTNNPGGTTAGFLSTPSFTSQNLPQGRNTPVWEAVDTFNWVKGRHNLQFGGDYRHVKASNYFFNAVTPNVNLGNNASNPDNLTNSSFPGGISTQGLANAQNVFDTITGLIGSTTQGFNHTSPTSGFVAGKPRFLDPVQHNFAFFGQDTFKLKPNLTVTLGLRWEYQGVFDLNSGLILQPDNRLQGVFGPAPVGDVFNPVTTPAATDVLLNFAGGNNGKPLYNRDWNNFAPTVGFAWDPFKDGKTAIRAGFATHYTTDGFTFFAPAATGNTGLFSTVTNANTTGVFNTSSVPTPAVPVDQFPVSAANNYGLGTNVTVSNNLVSFNQNLPVPYVLEWNLAVQREVAKNTTVEVRYVGNHGVKLYRATNYNELNLLNSPYTAGGASVANILTEFNNAANNLNICSQNLTACTGSAKGPATFANMGLPGQVPLPILQTVFTGISAGSSFSNATFINNLQQGQVGAMFDTIRRNALYFNNRQKFPLNFFVPNPWANSATLVDNSSWSRYNGLELELRRRFASSLSFQFDYTYSKDLTDQRFLPNGSQTDSQSYYTLANRSADKSRAPWDVTQNIAANALYSLPFGRGKRFGGNSGRLLDSLIGGFDIQGVANWATGQPYSILSDRLTVGAIANNTNAVLENMSISDFEKQLGVYKVPGGVFFINPNSGLITVKTTTGANGIPSVSSSAVMCTAGQTTPCFAHPTAGSYGNTPILGFNGPDFFNTDASIIKHIPITSDGTKNFEIRLEAFNVFNHPSFASPTTPGATNTTNPNVISSTTFGQLNTQVDSARGGGVTARIVQWAIRVNF